MKDLQDRLTTATCRVRSGRMQKDHLRAKELGIRSKVQDVMLTIESCVSPYEEIKVLPSKTEQCAGNQETNLAKADML